MKLLIGHERVVKLRFLIRSQTDGTSTSLSSINGFGIWLLDIFLKCGAKIATSIAKHSSFSSVIVPSQRLIVDECLKSGDLDRGELAAKIILAIYPNDRDAWISLTQIYEEKKLYSLCLENLNALLVMDENLHDADIHRMRTLLALQAIGPEVAEPYFQQLSQEFEPNAAMLDFYNGLIELHKNNLQKAENFFNNALVKFPKYVGAMVSLAQVLVALRRKPEAVSLLEQAADLAGPESGAYAVLASLNYYKSVDHDHVQQLLCTVKDETLPVATRKHSHFILGDIFDKLNLFDKAFEHYNYGNSLDYKFKQTSPYKHAVDEQLQVYDCHFINTMEVLKSESIKFRPIFLVGMPRSGSTLLEQILASHPEVYAGGELSLLDESIEKLEAECSGAYPSCIPSVDSSKLEEVAAFYIKNMTRHGLEKAVYTDKTLFNFLHLGIIHQLFPNAIIINCKRNPVDTCLSCFFQNFHSLLWMNDLSLIASVYKDYQRVMNHWQSVLPLEILEVEYERLVQSPEPEMRRMLDFCGLSWHPQCQVFHNTRRLALTASQYQVSSPIYSSSVGRWKNYERHIEELVKTFL